MQGRRLNNGLGLGWFTRCLDLELGKDRQNLGWIYRGFFDDDPSKLGRQIGNHYLQRQNVVVEIT
jgi:hypothetical protein